MTAISRQGSITTAILVNNVSDLVGLGTIVTAYPKSYAAISGNTGDG